MHFNNLPPELQEMIISFIDPRDHYCLEVASPLFPPILYRQGLRSVWVSSVFGARTATFKQVDLSKEGKNIDELSLSTEDAFGNASNEDPLKICSNLMAKYTCLSNLKSLILENYKFSIAQFPLVEQLCLELPLENEGVSLNMIQLNFPNLEILEVKSSVKTFKKSFPLRGTDFEFPFLKKLQLNGMGFTEDFDYASLANLQNLEKFGLNCVKDRSFVFEKIPHVREMTIMDNEYIEILDDDCLSNLRKLYTDKLFIYDLQDVNKLSVLQNLKILSISNSEPYAVPKIENLQLQLIPNLKILKFANVKLTQRFTKLSDNLQTVILKNCEIKVDVFDNQQNLIELQILGCQLDAIEWVNNYKNLKYLQIRDLVLPEKSISIPDLSDLSLTTLDMINHKSFVDFGTVKLPLTLKRIYFTIDSNTTNNKCKFPGIGADFYIANDVVKFNKILQNYKLEQQLSNELKPFFVNWFI